jgi:hypothetical protein
MSLPIIMATFLVMSRTLAPAHSPVHGKIAVPGRLDGFVEVGNERLLLHVCEMGVVKARSF